MLPPQTNFPAASYQRHLPLMRERPLEHLVAALQRAGAAALAKLATAAAAAPPPAPAPAPEIDIESLLGPGFDLPTGLPGDGDSGGLRLVSGSDGTLALAPPTEPGEATSASVVGFSNSWADSLLL